MKLRTRKKLNKIVAMVLALALAVTGNVAIFGPDNVVTAEAASYVTYGEVAQAIYDMYYYDGWRSDTSSGVVTIQGTSEGHENYIALKWTADVTDAVGLKYLGINQETEGKIVKVNADSIAPRSYAWCVLCRMSEVMKKVGPLPQSRKGKKFDDISGGSYVRTAAIAMYRAKLIGASNNKIQPKGHYTRAQLNSLLSKYAQIYPAGTKFNAETDSNWMNTVFPDDSEPYIYQGTFKGKSKPYAKAQTEKIWKFAKNTGCYRVDNISRNTQTGTLPVPANICHVVFYTNKYEIQVTAFVHLWGSKVTEEYFVETYNIRTGKYVKKYSGDFESETGNNYASFKKLIKKVVYE